MKGARGSSVGVGRSNYAPPISRDCPRCEVPRNAKCLDLRSWVEDPGHPAGGFYARRSSQVHPERKRQPAAEPVTSVRGDLRKRLSALAMRKLSASERINFRRWTGAVDRTEDELRERLAVLEAMTDLT